MSRVIVEGGHRLVGRVRPSGAKNAILPLLAASLLTDEECVFENVPCIEDTRTMLELLSHLGAEVSFDPKQHRLAVRAREIRSFTPPPHLVTMMRASFLVIGPLLARYGRAASVHPGGCAIGTRPVNVDIRGFSAMGAEIDARDGSYIFRAQRLKGTRLYLDYPSHTGTENLMMAASMAEGRTVITHASTEPEIVNLAHCLSNMGAKITGAGTSSITIEGQPSLRGVAETVAPDRIEAGTFAVAAAITGGEVTLEQVIPSYMEPLTYKLTEIGIEVVEGTDTYSVCGGRPLEATEVQALPYPGFPTDLQSAFATLLTQAQGTSYIHERVYDNRLLYAYELSKMGASIEVQGQTAIISGPTPLTGAEVRALDIRCGAALILGGLVAEGRTIIEDSFHIDRGYEDFVGKLQALGARVEQDTAKVSPVTR
ncbi:MAG: UDP-N-acetylglucosamine 1-carboxyvinyltransferase [Chloroflexi bacterium]|nr:UDP-N-acetylglucosamine 1-carboxyvinyltransferase [Chloroflexota bacterium]